MRLLSVAWFDKTSGTLRLARDESEEDVEGAFSPEVKPGILLAISLFRSKIITTVCNSLKFDRFV